MTAWLLGLAGSKWFWWVAMGFIALLFVGIVVLRIFNAGKAAEKMQTTLTVLARGLEARKAVAAVDHSPKAEAHDPFNRDPRYPR